MRAPEEAVRIAERAVGGAAAAGRWSDAARTAERAARIAAERSEAEDAARLRERASGYRRGEMPPEVRPAE